MLWHSGNIHHMKNHIGPQQLNNISDNGITSTLYPALGLHPTAAPARNKKDDPGSTMALHGPVVPHPEPFLLTT